jgi:hypothetical protein
MDNNVANIESDDESLDKEDDEEFDDDNYIVERVSNNYCDALKDAVNLKSQLKSLFEASPGVGNFRAVQVVLWQRKYEKMAIVDTF